MFNRFKISKRTRSYLEGRVYLYSEKELLLLLVENLPLVLYTTVRYVRVLFNAITAI